MSSEDWWTVNVVRLPWQEAVSKFGPLPRLPKIESRRNRPFLGQETLDQDSETMTSQDQPRPQRSSCQNLSCPSLRVLSCDARRESRHRADRKDLPPARTAFPARFAVPPGAELLRETHADAFCSQHEIARRRDCAAYQSTHGHWIWKRLLEIAWPRLVSDRRRAALGRLAVHAVAEGLIAIPAAFLNSHQSQHPRLDCHACRAKPHAVEPPGLVVSLVTTSILRTCAPTASLAWLFPAELDRTRRPPIRQMPTASQRPVNRDLRCFRALAR